MYTVLQKHKTRCNDRNMENKGGVGERKESER